MRILKALFFSFVILLVTLIVVVYGAREVLLIGSTWLISSRYNQVVQSVAAGDHRQECMKLGVFGGEAFPQLRFVSSTEYYAEAVCGTLSESALVITKYKLWPLVTKTTGDSGLTDQKKQAVVALEVLGRVASVEQDEFGNTHTVWRKGKLISTGAGPVTNCGGYGTTCCIEGEEQGIGDQIKGALDCPKTCYVACYSRPVILAFNSNPFYDYESRILTVKRGQTIDFSYVISESQRDVFADARLKENTDPLAILLSLSKQLLNTKKIEAEKEALRQVTLDFGDGETTTLSKLQDTGSHSYTCARELCRYTANLSAKNYYGAQTLAGYLSTITINVVP